MGINILGLGSYVPEQKLTNDDFTRFVETNDEWIRTRTGISERRMAGREPTWYMGLQAAKQAVEKVVFTVVDVISEEEIRQCEKIARDMGIEFRVREYIDTYQ